MRRRSIAVAVAVPLVVAAGVSAAVIAGQPSHGVRLSNAGARATVAPTAVAPAVVPVRAVAVRPACPLLGEPPAHGAVAHRPAVAVKVDNAPPTRPQTGLNLADVVFEEPVEYGITRFVAVFQCHSATVGPVRSGRMVDPDILQQLGRPVALAYSGGIQPSLDKIAASPFLVDLRADVRGDLFWRDPTRYAPYNLYTDTARLWAARGMTGPAPAPLFSYGRPTSTGTGGSQVEVPYSPYADVVWRYDVARHAYLRGYGTTRAMLSDGAQIATSNVVVEHVAVIVSPYVEDSNGGAHQLWLRLVGRGDARVFRDGRAYAGSWVRSSLDGRTQLESPQGRPLTLRPGTTWVELVPTTMTVQAR